MNLLMNVLKSLVFLNVVGSNLGTIFIFNLKIIEFGVVFSLFCLRFLAAENGDTASIAGSSIWGTEHTPTKKYSIAILGCANPNRYGKRLCNASDISNLAIACLISSSANLLEVWRKQIECLGRSLWFHMIYVLNRVSTCSCVYLYIYIYLYIYTYISWHLMTWCWLPRSDWDLAETAPDADLARESWLFVPKDRWVQVPWTTSLAESDSTFLETSLPIIFLLRHDLFSQGFFWAFFKFCPTSSFMCEENAGFQTWSTYPLNVAGSIFVFDPRTEFEYFLFFFEFFACNRKWGMGDFHPCHGHFQWILCSFALCPLTKSPNLGAVSRASKFHQLLLRSSEFHSSKPDGNRFIKCSLLHFHSVINYFGKTCARNPRNDSIDPAGTLGFTGRLGVPGRTWTYLVAFECQNKAWRMCDV